MGSHWKSLLFRDETCFYLSTSDEHIQARRNAGERLLARYILNDIPDLLQASWYEEGLPMMTEIARLLS